MRRILGIVTLALLLAAGIAPVLAQSATNTASDLQRSVFFFGGRFHSNDWNVSFLPWMPDYEDNYVLGGGYQQVFAEPLPELEFGLEAGLAGRFGESVSAELWGGAFLRYDGFVIGDTVRITPSFTAGFSAVTGTIGSEQHRAELGGRDEVPFLFYLGPEIALSTVEHPELEVFWRVQHRSGGFGLIAKVNGSNANVVGVRLNF